MSGGWNGQEACARRITVFQELLKKEREMCLFSTVKNEAWWKHVFHAHPSVHYAVDVRSESGTR